MVSMKKELQNSDAQLYDCQLELQTARQVISDAPKHTAKLESDNKRLVSTLSHHNSLAERLKRDKDEMEARLNESLSTCANLRAQIKNHKCPTVVREPSPDNVLDTSGLFSDEKVAAEEEIKELLAKLEERDVQVERLQASSKSQEKEIAQLVAFLEEGREHIENLQEKILMNSQAMQRSSSKYTLQRLHCLCRLTMLACHPLPPTCYCPRIQGNPGALRPRSHRQSYIYQMCPQYRLRRKAKNLQKHQVL